MTRARTTASTMAAAAEHERRTGMRANMQALGWRCGKRSKIDGVPLFFQQGSNNQGWKISKTRAGRWYCAKLTKPAAWPITKKVTGPDFDGPVAAALWLQVEIANDTVRFD